MKDMTSMIEEQKQILEDEKVFQTIAVGEKTFDFTKEANGFEASIKLKMPSLKQKNTAEAMYAKHYNKLLQDDDYLTTIELLNRAKKRGMWSEKEELRLGEIDEAILVAKERLDKETKKLKKTKLEETLAQLRVEKFGLAMRLANLTSTAIENVSETERTIYLLLNCAFSVNDSGEEEPLYKTRADIESETDMKKFEVILLEARSFWSGEGLSDFLHLDA